MDLNTRLELEISAAELPQDIRDKLTQAREGIKPLDFGTNEGFKSAYDMWEKTRQDIEKEIDASPELTAVVNYSIREIPKLDGLIGKTQFPK